MAVQEEVRPITGPCFGYFLRDVPTEDAELTQAEGAPAAVTLLLLGAVCDHGDPTVRQITDVVSTAATNAGVNAGAVQDLHAACLDVTRSALSTPGRIGTRYMEGQLFSAEVLGSNDAWMLV